LWGDPAKPPDKQIYDIKDVAGARKAARELFVEYVPPTRTVEGSA